MNNDADRKIPLGPDQPRPAPTDHGWINDGHGVLSCVAGDQHTTTRAVACPYYLRTDVVAGLPPGLTRTPEARPALARPDGLYHKITELAAPADWPALVAALNCRHRLQPLAWSLFSAVGLTPTISLLDPRDALRTALSTAPPSPTLEVLGSLAAALSDPGNLTGVLGLTGLAALQPARLPSALTGNHDVDLMLYPATLGDRYLRVSAVLRSLGAILPADLPDYDRRTRRYRISRLMPATTTAASAALFWRRRTDLAWIGDLRLDVTTSGVPERIDVLPYQTAPIGRRTAEVAVAAIGKGYPIRLQVEHPVLADVLITARGYQTVLRVGDQLTVTGWLHSTEDDALYLSVDDCAGHHITLRREGAP